MASSEPFEIALEEDIRQALPRLSDADVQLLLNKLLKIVDSAEDLPYLQTNEVQPPLKPATARRFVQFLHKRYGESGSSAGQVDDETSSSYSENLIGSSNDHRSLMSASMPTLQVETHEGHGGQRGTGKSPAKYIPSSITSSTPTLHGTPTDSDRRQRDEIEMDDRSRHSHSGSEQQSDYYRQSQPSTPTYREQDIGSRAPGHARRSTPQHYSTEESVGQIKHLSAPTKSDDADTDDNEEYTLAADNVETHEATLKGSVDKGINQGKGRDKQSKKKDGKRGRNERCQLEHEFTDYCRRETTLSVVFYIMVPKSSKNVHLCLHTPESVSSVRTPMTRIQSEKHMFTCPQDICWDKVAYHPVVDGHHVDTPLVEMSFTEDPDPILTQTMKRYYFDRSVYFGKARSRSGSWWSPMTYIRPKEDPTPKIVSAMMSCIDWSTVQDWYQQLSDLHKCMSDWDIDTTRIKELATKMKEMFRILNEENLTKENRIRLALALICLERKEIISRFDQGQKETILESLRMSTSEQSRISDEAIKRMQRSFIIVQDFIKSVSQAPNETPTWLTCIPLLRLLDPDHDAEQEMPKWWKCFDGAVSSFFVGKSKAIILKCIEPIMSMDRVLTMALLRLLDPSQLSAIHDALPADIILDATLLLIPRQIMSAEEELRMRRHFKTALSKLGTNPFKKTQTDKFQSASRRCAELMRELDPDAENIRTRILLADFTAEMTQVSNWNKDIEKHFTEVVYAGVLSFLKPSAQGSLCETTIKMMNEAWNANFVSVMGLQAAFKEHLQNVLSQVQPHEKVQALGSIWKLDPVNLDFQFCLRESAKIAIKDSIENGNGESIFSEDCCNQSTYAVYTEIFNESWEGQDPLKHILSWPHMDLFLQCFGKTTGKMTSCLEKLRTNSNRILGSIGDASISNDDMQFIIDQQDNFKNIIKTTSASTIVTRDEKALESLLDVRRRQLEFLGELDAGLTAFQSRCDQAGYDNIESLDLLKPEQVKGRQMKDLIGTETNGSSSLRLVDLPDEVMDVLPTLVELERAVVFDPFFDKMCPPNTTEINSLTLEEFARDIIGVSITKWEEMRTEMDNGSIKLQWVQPLFETLKEEDWKTQLLVMCRGHDVVDERLTQITCFFKLRQHEKAAGSIMNLRATYRNKLSGDFDVLQKVTEMDESATLASITGDTESIVAELNNLGRKELVWLEKYDEAHPLVTWLQKELATPKEVETLLDMQFYTSSDHTDLEMSKASSLLKVVKVFSPLIYELPANAGLHELLDKFKEIWDQPGRDENILKQLTSLKDDMEWLKELRKRQSSVGRDALSKVKDINTMGIYRVGNLYRNTIDLNKMIIVTVPDEDGKDETYTYSELQNLQSTLMLVAGQDEQKTTSKQTVQEFSKVLNTVRGMAETFSKLCDNGNILFGDWTSDFYCNEKTNVSAYVNFGLASGILAGPRMEGPMFDHINQVWEFMSGCLEDWTKHVQTQRKRFPVLNSFTTRQIVILRSELSKITEHGPEGLNDKIFSLLQTVLPDCTSDDVNIAWVDTVRKMETTPQQEPLTENVQTMTKEELVIRNLQSRGLHREQIIRAIKENDTYDEQELMLWCWKREDNAKAKGTVDSTAIQREETHQSIMEDLLQRVQKEETSGNLKERLNSLWNSYLSTNTTKSLKDYLSVVHLGHMLTFLKDKCTETISREFPTYFNKGRPNLLLCEEENVWETVLSTYMHEDTSPLPTRDEVLLCTPQTSAEEVQLLLMRASVDMEKIFMLVKIDQLSYTVAQQVEGDMQKILQGCPNYRLVVICCREHKDGNILVSALYSSLIESTITRTTKEIRDYVGKHIKVCNANEKVSSDGFSVKIVQSQRAGVGKTLWVRNQKAAHPDMRFVGLPLHGKTLNIPAMVNRMCEHTLPPDSKERTLFHIDIPHEMNVGVDQLLFELIILKSLSDPKGYLWARSEHDFYAIEVMPLQRWEVQSGVKGTEARRPVHNMLELLPSLTCHAPKECMQIMRDQDTNTDQQKTTEDTTCSETDMLMDEGQFRSEPLQRVYQFLLLLKENNGLESINPQKVKGTMIHCLGILLQFSEIDNPSWAELNYFVQFLNIQWNQFQSSKYWNLNAVPDDLVDEPEVESTPVNLVPGFSEFVVRAMLQMSKDFVGRSLQIANEIATHDNGDFVGRSLQNADEIPMHDESTTEATDDIERETVEKYELKRKWKCANPYIFLNPDGHTMTFLGYHVDKNSMALLDPQTKEELMPDIMSEELYSHLIANNVSLEEDLDKLLREDQLKKMYTAMGMVRGENSSNLDNPYDPDPNYVLTSDNIKKMLAIYMRFRANIPVIVMGESGCGKTYLVNFLCRLQKPTSPGAAGIKNRFVLKIHGNITEKDLIEKVREAEVQAKKNHKRYPGLFTVVFLDEVNTTEALSLVKEILCDHTINGEPLDMNSGLRFVAACNPYKMHSEEMIKQMEEGGLGYHVQSEKASDRFGRIPMRHLVYRVEPLPQSLLPLVWDFGQLDDKTEERYIKKIVEKHLEALPEFKKDRKQAIGTIADILHVSQCYMRSRKDECSHVSLRDPERAMTIMKWFLKNKNVLDNNTPDCPDTRTWALIMTLGVCYHAALGTARSDYTKEIVKHFRGMFKLQHDGAIIEKVIERCQEKFVDNMTLEPTIAKNEALKENIFMMAVCMELRIPLFIIGKPGSSKTLSRQILADEMSGQASKSDLFKQLKKVQMQVYQCSPLSTAEGIIDLFKTCSAMQENREPEEFVSVVVLDEVGLAEDTPEMPLKTLHHLLEHDRDGDENTELNAKVGFLGLSNWSLDPAKNNRALMVRRKPPDANALQETAKALSLEPRLNRQLAILLPKIAKGYYDLYTTVLNDKHNTEFFGLRDFYSLVKMIYAFADKYKPPPTTAQLKHAILRNFGGILDFDPLGFFEGLLKKNSTKDGNAPDNTITGLIQWNLNRASLPIESRHLLLLTENQAALSIIQERFEELQDAVIIFGSSFPNDLDFTKLCRAINRIKLCMENGKTVILLNQEPIFESLYDALNQYYTYFGGIKHVDVGLGSQRMKCRVHDKFKLVVIADSKTVHAQFPIPLINRFEKHYLATSTILNKAQRDVIKDLNLWIKRFITKDQGANLNQGSKRSQAMPICTEDIFIGYHKEVPSAIVLQVCKELKQTEGGDTWKKKVLDKCKKMLLLCATPESIILVEETALKDETDAIRNIYLKEQQHESLSDFLHKQISVRQGIQDSFMQVTTHSKLLSKTEAEVLNTRIGIQTLVVPIQSFTTEHEFSEALRSFHSRDTKGKDDVLILQCDSGHEHQDLLACCRYIIIDERRRQEEAEKARKHVVLVVQLPRLAGGCFSGFQMQPWECVHIDELHPHHQMPPIHSLLKGPVSDVLRPQYHPDHNESGSSRKEELDFRGLFQFCIIPAMSILKDASEMEVGSNISRVDKLNNLLKRMTEQDQTEFLALMRKRIYLLQEEREKSDGEENARKWLSKVATQSMEMKMLTFRTQVRQYVQNKMTGLIAGIIAFADCNNNLDILLKDDEPWKKCMWLKMLNDEKATNLSIEEDLGQSEPQEIPVKSHGANGSKMEGRLPFSWMIFKQIDGCMKAQKNEGFLKAARSVPSVLKENAAWKTLCDGLKEDTKNTQDEQSRIMENYLPDFVAMVYKPQTAKKELERQLVQQEINRQHNAMLVENSAIGLKEHIPLIHAAYEKIQSRIEIFSQIVQRRPEVLEEMKKDSTAPKLGLELRAVKHAIELMQPSQQQLREAEDSMTWYESTGRMAPLINQALYPVQNDNDQHENVSQEVTDLMNEWERIITVRMFASVVCPPDSDKTNMLLFCPLLWTQLDKANMKTSRTMAKVDEFFKSITKWQKKELIKTCPACKKDLVDVFVLPCGHEVCIECVKTRQTEHTCIECKKEHPEDIILTKQLSSGQQRLISLKNSLQSFRMELVSRLCLPGPTPPEDELIELLMKNITETREENEDGTADRMMKTVLLQLLMSSHPEKVRKHLNMVFESGPALGKHHLELAVLYVQCFEDKNHNRVSKTIDQNRVREIATLLRGCFDPLKDTSLNVHRLEAIALTRFCLSETADWLEKIYIQKIHVGSEVFKQVLLPVVQDLYDKGTSWPSKYLIKLLVRRFGLDNTVTLSKEKDIKQLLKTVPTAEDAYPNPDPFTLYGHEYIEACKCLSTGLSTENIKGWLEQNENRNCGDMDQILMLAFIRSANNQKQYNKVPAMKIYLKESKKILQKDLLSKLLDDSLAINCDALRLALAIPDARDRVLRDMLLHLYITMRDTPTITILEPLKFLIHKPAKMENAYLPTMPQDEKGHKPQVYACQSGHIYPIAECGKPVQATRCPKCGQCIGLPGKKNDRAQGKEQLSGQDQTKTGHILGVAADLRTDIVPERKLSLLQANIMRLLLHLSLCLGANQHAEEVCRMIHPTILKEEEVVAFLLSHLHHDLSVLTQTMSIDDAVLLIHTIIIKMTEFTDAGTTLQEPLLMTKESREKWEDDFVTTVLSTVLEEKEDILETAHRQLVKHSPEGMSELLRMVYETEDDDTDIGDPVNMAVMWRYRLQVNFKTATQALAVPRCGGNTQQGDGSQHELLYYFMQNEPELREVQLLPRIIKFQKILLQKYDHKITQKNASDTPIKKFLQNDAELLTLFEDYQRVWDIQKRCQFEGRKEVDSTPLELNTKLDKFLPQCETLNTLVQIHNALIEKLGETTVSTCNLGPDVNLLDVKPTHLVTYDPDKDLLPLVTANCSSSLKLGEGTKVKYDFDKMEYQLRERFFEGKSKIVNENITMVFSDSLTAVHKLENLKDKIPQVPLTTTEQADLHMDTQYVSDVYNLVANLDIAISFLHALGGDPNRLLEDFMRDDLGMKHAPLPSMTKRHCKLKHINALWLFMSNEREKHAAKLGAVPFATLNEQWYECFRDELGDRQTTELNKKLPHANLERLLMDLFTCITLKIIQSDGNTDGQLRESLADMGSDAALLELPDGVDSIKVSQCMDTWRFIFKYTLE